MRTLLKILSELTNLFHWLFEYVFSMLGISLTDKDLHFIVIGIMGIFIFIFTNVLFKFLAKYSIELISFVFTFTVLIVITFAIEIQQYVTGSGNMEFDDIIFGLFGFLSFIFIYVLFKMLNLGIKYIINK